MSAGLVGLALTFGLGDIAQVSPLDVLILNGVHGLLLLAIGLALASAASQRRWPSFPREVGLPTAVWLCVLLVSATLAQHYRGEAIAPPAQPGMAGRAQPTRLNWRARERSCRKRRRA